MGGDPKCVVCVFRTWGYGLARGVYLESKPSTDADGTLAVSSSRRKKETTS